MNKNTLRLTLASVAACSVITLGSSPASAYDEHVDAAEEFIFNATVNDTDTTNGCWINWTDSNSLIGHTKGACYFTELLKGGFGYAAADIKALWGTPGQLGFAINSQLFFNKINSSPVVGAPAPATETYFRRITNITGVHRGDVIAIGETSTYAGHVMIVRGDPIAMIGANALPPFYSGTIQWAVPITDSTTAEHGASGTYKDSRCTGTCVGSAFDAGAGLAYIRIYTDLLTSNLLGYTWSATSNSPYLSPSTRPYRIGRLVNLPAALPPPPPPPPPPPFAPPV